MKQRIAISILLLSLAACGGGGGDAGSPTTPPTQSTSAEGFWSGTTSSGYELGMAVLEDGQAWGIYTRNSTAYGVIQGTIAVTGTAFSFSGYDFNIPTTSRTAGNGTGTVVAKTSMQGNAGTTTFALAYDAAYDSPAKLSDIQGAWSLSTATSTGTLTTSINIAADGSLTGSNAFCTVKGTILPRASGKNVFNMALTSITGANCSLAGKTASGIATLSKSATRSQLAAAGLTPDKSDGFLAIGSR